MLYYFLREPLSDFDPLALPPPFLEKIYLPCLLPVLAEELALGADCPDCLANTDL
jgi:hypothetical protein